MINDAQPLIREKSLLMEASEFPNQTEVFDTIEGIQKKMFQELLNNKTKLVEWQLDNIIEGMPEPISNLVNNFQSGTEKFIVLACALVAAGAISPNVSGFYHGRKTMAALYLSIVAGAASNKGVVNYTKVLLKKIHKYYRNQSENAMAEYLEQLKQQKKNKKGGESYVPLKRPPYQVVIVSGDITGAKLLEQLYDNAGIPCILIEDEMDAMVQSGSGEHGKQINRLLRNIYHHAHVSIQRKGDNQHYEVEEPFMCIIMAGTPDQLKNLLGSYENGLSSRFTILTFDDGPVWLSPAPCKTCPDRNVLVERTADAFFDYWKFMRDRKLEVQLTAEQWKVIDVFGERELALMYNFQHETLSAVVKRTSLQIYRMAMILTAFRVWEQNENLTVATCSDEDFESAFKLIQHAYLCGIEFFQEFQGKAAVSATASSRDRLFKALPDSFSRQAILDTARALCISKRSADGYAKDLIVGGLLEKVGHGLYRKSALAKQTPNWNSETL